MPRDIVSIHGKGGGAAYGVSRYLAAADRAFWQVVVEQDDYLTDSEANLMQTIGRQREAELLAAIATSGLFGAAAFGYGGSLSATQFSLPESRANVGGVVVHVANPANAANACIVDLGAKPGSGSRTDAAFLEAWLQEVAPATNPNGADTAVFRYGGVANTTLANDIADPLVNTETTRRVQLRWRLRPIQGITTLGSNPSGLGDPLCLAQGAAGAPVAGLPYKVSAADSHLWVAGDGLVAALPAPATVTATPTGTAGTSSYSYRVTAYYSGPNGEFSETTTTAGTTSTGNATLSVGNTNAVAWTSVAGASGYKVYGRIAGSEQLLATVVGQGTTSWADTGALAPSGAYPTRNTTGGYALLGAADGYSYAIPLAVVARTSAETGILGGAVTDVRANAATWPVLQAGNQTISGSNTASYFVATVATGTAPFQATSTTLCANLNAQYLGGFPAGTAGGTQASSVAVTNAGGQVGLAAAALAVRDTGGVARAGTAPGGTQASSVAITDGSGQVGRALLATAAVAVQDNGGLARAGTAPGGVQANSAAITNASGRVGAALVADALSGSNTTTPGGTQPNATAITSGAGQVGSALVATTATNLLDNGGVARAGTAPGGTQANSVAITDGSGQVGGAKTLAGYGATSPGGTQAGSVAVTDSAGRVGHAATADYAVSVGGSASTTTNVDGDVPQITTINTYDLGINTNLNGYAMSLYVGHAPGTNALIAYALGTGPGSVAYVQSDGLVHNNITGSAAAVRDAGGTTRTLATPGTNPANVVASYDGSGRVGDSANLGGQGPGAYATAAALTAETNTRAAHTAAGLSAAVHGYNVSSPGSYGSGVANTLAQLDGSGAVGLARNLLDAGGTARGVGTPGSATANAVAVADGGGSVASANSLQGHQVGTGSGQLPLLDGNGAVAAAEALAVGGARYAPAAGPGVAAANAIPIMDGGGFVAGANALAPGAQIRVGGGSAYFAALANSSESDGGYLEYWPGGGANMMHLTGQNATALATLFVTATDSQFTGALHAAGTIYSAGNAVPTVDGFGAVPRAEAAGNVWKRGDPTTSYPPTDTGGAQANCVAVTDGNGAVGKANSLYAQDGSYRNATTPGGNQAGALAVTDGSGHVGVANQVSTSYLQRGTTGAVANDSNGNANFSVTFSPTMAGTPTVLGGLTTYKPANAAACVASGVSATGCTLNVGFANTSNQTVQACYLASCN